jgi:hypothetical protein
MSTNYMEKVKRTQSSSFVGYWPLNEESGTTVYNIVRPAQQPMTTTPHQNGTSANLVRTPEALSFLAPDGSKCARFDGSTSYIDMIAALSSSATTTGSLSIWAAIPQANLAGTTKMVLCYFAVDGDYQHQLYFDTTAYRFTAMHDANSEKTSTSSLVYNMKGPQYPEWHHFGYDFVDAGSLNFYVDGVAQTAATSLGTWSGSYATALMCLGSDNTTISDAFNGWLAHFAWWSKVLTADEWRDLANARP